MEATAFYGKRTLFVGKLPKDRIDVLRLLKKSVEFEHVYFGTQAKGFANLSLKMGQLAAAIKGMAETICMEHGHLVTVELPPTADPYTVRLYTEHRQRFGNRFRLMLTIVVPELLRGGFAIKALPEALFTEAPFSGGVKVIDGDSMLTTSWAEYEPDEEVSLI